MGLAVKTGHPVQSAGVSLHVRVVYEALRLLPFHGQPSAHFVPLPASASRTMSDMERPPCHSNSVDESLTFKTKGRNCEDGDLRFRGRQR